MLHTGVHVTQLESRPRLPDTVGLRGKQLKRTRVPNELEPHKLIKLDRHNQDGKKAMATLINLRTNKVTRVSAHKCKKI